MMSKAKAPAAIATKRNSIGNMLFSAAYFARNVAPKNRMTMPMRASGLPRLSQVMNCVDGTIDMQRAPAELAGGGEDAAGMASAGSLLAASAGCASSSLGTATAAVVVSASPLAWAQLTPQTDWSRSASCSSVALSTAPASSERRSTCSCSFERLGATAQMKHLGQQRTEQCAVHKALDVRRQRRADDSEQ